MPYVNLAVRFLLELLAFSALGYWGFRTGRTLIGSILFGIGTPLVAVIIWGSFVAPKASWRLRDPLRLLVELVIFGSAALALWGLGLSMLAVTFAALVFVSIVLMFVWRQRGIA